MTTHLEAITATDARRITDQIKAGVEAVWHLIEEAYTSRAWAALGYQSWDDYCTREFGTSRIRLPREERQEVVASLRESGLSIRAIASATGSSVGTIHAELSGVQNRTPDAEPITGTDGKTYTPKPRPIIDQNAGANNVAGHDEIAPGLTADELDALNTPKPQPSTPKRRPLTDQARDAGWELRKSIERLERIASDDLYQDTGVMVSFATLRRWFPERQTRVAA